MNFANDCIYCGKSEACIQLNDNKSWLCKDCTRALKSYVMQEPRNPKPNFEKIGFSEILWDYTLNSTAVAIAYPIGILIFLFSIFWGMNSTITIIGIGILFALLTLISSLIIMVIQNICGYANYRTKLINYNKNEDHLVLAQYYAKLKEYTLIRVS